MGKIEKGEIEQERGSRDEESRKRRIRETDKGRERKRNKTSRRYKRGQRKKREGENIAENIPKINISHYKIT